MDREVRAEISASTKETWRDPAIRASRVRKVFSPEARAACAAAARRSWQDPEVRAQRCAAISAARKANHAAKRGDIEVPLWVAKAGLAKRYLAHARAKGEFAAARLCRKLKAEGSA